jgi:hypothetical protein
MKFTSWASMLDSWADGRTIETLYSQSYFFYFCNCKHGKEDIIYFLDIRLPKYRSGLG